VFHSMDSCIFCSIIRGTEPASIVYSDEKVLAFLDIQPVNPGHVLVIPKVHAAQLAELEEEIGAQMFKIAMRIAAAIRKSEIRCEGINLHLADGEAASQDVFHIHLHIIPRFKSDSFGMRFNSHYGSKPKREELDAIASKIREALS
jgi:histidine triad (HIT) family protein